MLICTDNNSVYSCDFCERAISEKREVFTHAHKRNYIKYFSFLSRSGSLKLKWHTLMSGKRSGEVLCIKYHLDFEEQKHGNV